MKFNLSILFLLLFNLSLFGQRKIVVENHFWEGAEVHVLDDSEASHAHKRLNDDVLYFTIDEFGISYKERPLESKEQIRDAVDSMMDKSPDVVIAVDLKSSVADFLELGKFLKEADDYTEVDYGKVALYYITDQ